MIKIFYFLNSTVRGGVEEHVLCLLKGIDRTKFDPAIVCPQELLDLIGRELKEYNVRSFPVCIRSWKHFSEIKKFIGILEQEKPHIVHSHLFFATFFSAPISKFCGVPVVIDTAHIREAWRKGIKRNYLIDRIFYRFVDRIIAVSDAVKRYMIDDKGLPQKKIVVVKNGVDLSRFHPTEKGINNGALKIGVLGRLEPQKGHRYFLEAIRTLGDKTRGVEFLIVGEGSLRAELEQLAKDLHIEKEVVFLGYRSDVVKILDDIDVFVLPSLFEGLPLVALEASAMKKAVIVTNVDGSPEVVIHNETGLVVPAKDSDALKNAMLRFIEDRAAIVEHGKRARAHVEKEFDIRKQVRETEIVYEMAVRCTHG